MSGAFVFDHVRTLRVGADPLGEVLLARDEHVRPDSTADALAALKPAFAEAGERNGYDSVAISRRARTG
jgi:acetyl-CoA acetyltransferase